MSDRIEVAIAALVLGAVGSVLVAPLLGRGGATWWADVAMAAASLAGVAAFVLAALVTLRAARAPRARPDEKEEHP